jgi:hypothetical protein
VKIRPWGAAKAEGMGAFFNTLLGKEARNAATA